MGVNDEYRTREALKAIHHVLYLFGCILQELTHGDPRISGDTSKEFWAELNSIRDLADDIRVKGDAQRKRKAEEETTP